MVNHQEIGRRLKGVYRRICWSNEEYHFKAVKAVAYAENVNVS